jgi:hypothetical protein
MRRRPARPPLPGSEFTGFCFPPEVIVLTVRWYLRYALSYRYIDDTDVGPQAMSGVAPGRRRAAVSTLDAGGAAAHSARRYPARHLARG